jgi:enoyl-CoA hydratase/carnithine racemase
MAAMLSSRLPPQAAHEAMVTGRRFGGMDAEALGIVDRALAEDGVRATALEIAGAHLSRAGDTLGTIKARLYAHVLAALRDTTDPLGGPTAQGSGL